MTHRIKQIRKHVKQIFDAGLKAVNASEIIRHNCSLEQNILQVGQTRYDLSTIEHVYVIGAGKACAPMAKEVEMLLGDRISDGVVCVKYDHGEMLKRIRLMEAAHPVPDENGVNASRAMLEVAKKTTRNDLVICLLTGGGSALLPMPAAGITLEDKQQATQLLLGCGADIHEVNTVRKHLSAIKGGQLAKAVAPARMVTLIQSDVVGDDLDVIASGPCVPDQSTFQDAFEILNRYDLFDTLSENIQKHIERGVSGNIDDTPKKDEPFFLNVETLIASCNQDALEACLIKAKSLGYHSLILTSKLTGDCHTIADLHAGIAKQVLKYEQPLALPACILSGGETTLVLKGDGKGGRNQEAALKAAIEIDNCPRIVMLCAGTDGTDGPTDAAGALVDHTTIKRAHEKQLAPRAFLNNNDAYHFFKALEDLLITGPTGANVMDLNIVLVSK